MNTAYQYISFNKEFIPAHNFKLDVSNRAFRYGDGFFETMHANGLEIQFITDHFSRIKTGAKILSLELPDYFTCDFIKKQIAGLLSRNKLFQGARVRLTLYRGEGGLYFPKTNEAQILIEAGYLSKGPYELNTEGLTVGIYTDMPKPKTLYSGIKSINSQTYILACIFAQKNGFDDVCLVTEKGNIIEASSSNFFAIKNKTLFTPSLNTGCVDGIMRKQIIHLAKLIGFTVNFDTEIYPGDLLAMDELFLTNAITGIKYISAFENRRYYKKNTSKLMIELNRLAFSNSFRDL